ncbi:hypothetical protein JW948_05735 [bacterium]|nr:hypothetical protein [bacterium]
MKLLNRISLTTVKMVMACCVFLVCGHSIAQEVIGAHEIRWLRVGDLHTWYSNSGAEVEYGRRGRACCEATDQADNMYWEAMFQNTDRNAAKGTWLATTDFQDPVSGEFYAYKVVQTGPRYANNLTNFMPAEFKMVGRFKAPIVVVDGDVATDNFLNDQVDEEDPELLADRMIVGVLHTNVGATVTRRIMAFSQQYHNNYHIYEYTIKNTGIYDPDEDPIERTLTGVYLQFLYRHTPGWEATRFTGWGASGNVGWGRNTVSDVFGEDPNAPGFDLRGFYSYYGPHSGSIGYEEDWGAPRPDRPSVLGAPAFVGIATMHADRGPNDPSDDPAQPRSTPFMGSDAAITSSIDSYNAERMAAQYEIILIGHPADGDQAEQMGDSFADQFGTDAGGYIQSVGYGPYTLGPGDSVRIVIAEAVAGLCRKKSQEVGTNWYMDAKPFDMPDGTTTNDRNAYKKAWVFTARDSIMQTYHRALDNFNSGYQIPQPPPPPATFEVRSGGDRILLSWADNATAWPVFDGYRIFRAVGKPDTFYTEIFSCDRGDAVHEFEDMTALRSVDYYYYIQSKDDGSANIEEPGVPLCSSKYYTMTNAPAYLRRQARMDLNAIRIVPNPFHIRARVLQFPNADDRIAFFNLPPKCTIRIYTERGDLIKTLNHVDGSGDEKWDCTTDSNQILVSGLYIAYVEATESAIDEASGKSVQKGDSITKKFIVIR